MSTSLRRLVAVSLGEALSLLGEVSVGRIVFTDHALPAVRPASHLVEDGEILVRSHDGSAVLTPGDRATGARSADGAEADTVIAYEADRIDVAARLGWSVVVTGTATAVTDPDEALKYASVLRPWTAAEGQLIRLRPGIVTGYQLIA